MSVTKRKLVTNFKQLAAPRELRNKLVETDEKLNSGEYANFLAWELTALDIAVWREANERLVPNQDLRFLALTLRDGEGNRIWEETDDAVAQLGKYGASSLRELMIASNEMNFSDIKSAEKNSEAAQSDGSPSNSA